MNASKKAAVCDLIFNILIVLSTIIAVSTYFFGAMDALGSSRSLFWKFFTTESNILVSIAAFILIFYDIKKLKDTSVKVPKWLTVLRFVGTVSVSITFLTVLFFLAPTLGIFLPLFTGNSFALHLTTPLLSIFSFIFFERDHKMLFREMMLGLLPTVIYSVVYFLMVVVFARWPDWYGFSFGGHYEFVPAVVAVMYSFTFLVSWAEWKLRKAFLDRIGQKEKG